MPFPAKQERFTFSDVLTWDENERIEIIHGEVFMMAPPSRIHQEISGEIFRQLANYLEGKRCKVYSAPFGVRLFERAGDSPENVDTVVEPDISVVCDQSKLDDHSCKGAPDMLIEILSPSTPSARPAGEAEPVPAGRGAGILDRGSDEQVCPGVFAGQRRFSPHP